MRSARFWLLAPVLGLSSLIAACGDDGGDGDGSGDDTPRAGASASGGPGTSGAGGSTSSGGAGPSSGSGGKAPSSGNVTGSTKVSEIDTAAEVEAACERAIQSFDAKDLQAMREGTCTFAGLFAALQGADCEQAKAACLADEDELTECSADDFPNCDVTLDEYIACSNAQAKVAAALYGELTCDSDLSSLPTEAPELPAACVSVYAACDELSSGPQ